VVLAGWFTIIMVAWVGLLEDQSADSGRGYPAYGGRSVPYQAGGEAQAS